MEFRNEFSISGEVTDTPKPLFRDDGKTVQGFMVTVGVAAMKLGFAFYVTLDDMPEKLDVGDVATLSGCFKLADGKIVVFKEYMDTLHASQALAKLPPFGGPQKARESNLFEM